MNIQDIRNHSIKTKKTAEQILEGTGIEKILSKHGSIFVGGSFALNLMYGPDIDIVVESNNPRDSSLKVLKDLLNTRHFRKYEYGDFVKHPRNDRPRGYIVNLIKEFDKRRWEIEIWFFKSPRSEERDYIKEIKSQLTSEKRDTILKFKHRRAKEGVSKHKLSSVQIYKEVLADKARDTDEVSNK